MRAAVTAGITAAVENEFPIVPSNADQWEDFITQATNRVLEALAAAGHNTGYAGPIILPQATPVAVVSLSAVIAAAATDALNANAAAADEDEDDQDLGACILTGDDSEDEDDCTTHEHEEFATNPFANHVVYQLPAESDLRQVRNLVRAIAPLFGTAVYYRAADETGSRVMDVASPADVKDVFTQTVTGLTAACRQYITEQRMYPRAASTLYATLGTMLADDLNAISADNHADGTAGFLTRSSELPTSQAMLRSVAGAPSSRLSYVSAADEHSEIAGAARILLIENAPSV